MNWTINLMYAVLMTSISGTLLFGFWYGIGRLMESTGFLNVVYELLKVVLVFWYVPVAYAVLVYENNTSIYLGGFLFRGTPAIRLISKIFCFCWLLIVGLFLIRYTVIVWNSRRAYRYAIFCDDREYACFEEVCKELKINPDKVDLVQDKNELVPKIIGVQRPMIILPTKEFTNEELRVIYMHELTHYRQKDLWLIYFSELAKCFHFFNPVVWIFSKKVQYWGEYACDYEVVERMGNLKAYFGVIVKMAIEVDNRGILAAHLVEKKNDLVDRMERMKRSYRMKNKSKFKAGLLVAAMIIMSTCSVSAATVTAGNTYVKAYFATVDQEQENFAQIAKERSIDESDFVEYEESAFDEGVVVEEGEVDYRNRASYTYGWTIGRYAAKKSNDFSASSGGYISVSATSDASVSFRMGIIEPDGTHRYVNSSSGYAAYKFDLDQTGTYSVYVQNMTGSTIDVSGSYYVR